MVVTCSSHDRSGVHVVVVVHVEAVIMVVVAMVVHVVGSIIVVDRYTWD